MTRQRQDRALRLLSNLAAEDLQRPPLWAPLAAKELRARARHGHRVTISAEFAAALADYLDPMPAEETP